MFGCHTHKGSTKHRVLTCRKHRDMAVAIFQRKINLGSQALSDPILLHSDHFLGPPRETVTILQEIVRVIGDAEKPLVQLLLDYHLTTAPAQTRLDLLVGQHGLATLAPVYGCFFSIDHPLFEHLNEEPLFPTVVFGLACGQFSVPVIAESEPLELGAHGVNIPIRPFGGVYVVCNGRIFCRHPKGIPSHGVKHVVALHTFVPRHDVPNCVIAHMSHMDVAGGIGKHFQQVILFLGRIFFHPKQLFVLPDALPLGFYKFRVVFFLHLLPLDNNFAGLVPDAPLFEPYIRTARESKTGPSVHA